MRANAGAPGRRRAKGGKRVSGVLSIRLHDSVREALTAAAKEDESTLSRKAAELIERSLATGPLGLKPDFDHEEDRGLAHLLVALHRSLRQYTGRSWRDNAFTFQRFAEGVELLMRGLGAQFGFLADECPVPERLAEIYQNSPLALLDNAAPRPEELGRWFAAHLLDTVLRYDGPGPFARHRTGFVSEHWEFPQAARDLRIGRAK